MIPVLLLHLLCICSPAASQSYWNQQRDDLSEYQLEQTKASVRSNAECAVYAQNQFQAIDFNQSDGTCRMYSCLRGLTGCRKCRNARNSSLPLLLVRLLDQLGHNCWRTFQHRVDASVDFYRNWTDYLTSFGQGEERNYWMGLEAIHQLTKDGDRRARWEMSTWNGSWFWWEDLAFAVQGADQGYRLTVGAQDNESSNVVHCPASVTGNYMNNQQFSTPDKDQDRYSGSCAVTFHGSWWYSACHCIHPNGRYFTPPTAFNLSGNLWASGLSFEGPGTVYPLTSYYSMQAFECMVSDTG